MYGYQRYRSPFESRRVAFFNELGNPRQSHVSKNRTSRDVRDHFVSAVSKIPAQKCQYICHTQQKHQRQPDAPPNPGRPYFRKLPCPGTDRFISMVVISGITVLKNQIGRNRSEKLRINAAALP